MLRAVADTTRLHILIALGRGKELCVLDLAERLKVSQPKVSRHLAYLRSTGLVVTRRAGLKIYYRLTPAVDEFHQKLLECLASCFEDRSTLTIEHEPSPHNSMED
jgi:ArsR family transcriptional regulator